MILSIPVSPFWGFQTSTNPGYSSARPAWKTPIPGNWRRTVHLAWKMLSTECSDFFTCFEFRGCMLNICWWNVFISLFDIFESCVPFLTLNAWYRPPFFDCLSLSGPYQIRASCLWHCPTYVWNMYVCATIRCAYLPAHLSIQTSTGQSFTNASPDVSQWLQIKIRRTS